MAAKMAARKMIFGHRTGSGRHSGEVETSSREFQPQHRPNYGAAGPATTEEVTVGDPAIEGPECGDADKEAAQIVDENESEQKRREKKKKRRKKRFEEMIHRYSYFCIPMIV